MTRLPGAPSDGWPPHVKWDNACTVVRIWVKWDESLEYLSDSTAKTICDSDIVFYQSEQFIFYFVKIKQHSFFFKILLFVPVL